MKPKLKVENTPGGAPTEPVFRKIARARIIPSPTNMRTTFPEETLRGMAESIRVDGIKQPLLVRPLPKFTLRRPDLMDKRYVILADGQETGFVWDASYGDDAANDKLEQLEKERNGAEFEIIAGERRWRAAELAGLAELPCLIESGANEKARRRWQLIENDQREDLNALDRARGYQAYLDDTGCTKEELGKLIGRERSTVYETLALLKASRLVKEALERGKISESIGRTIMRYRKTEAEQEKALIKIVEKDLSHRAAEAYLKELTGKVAKPAGPSIARAAAPKKGFGEDAKTNTRDACATPEKLLFAKLNGFLHSAGDTIMLTVSKSGTKPDTHLRVVVSKFAVDKRAYSPVELNATPEELAGPQEFSLDRIKTKPSKKK